MPSSTPPSHASPTAAPQAKRIAIIGGGPAGLMAAETLLAEGYKVDLFDAMPSVGRKFLIAGKGGMNITHSEPLTDFISRYSEHQATLAPWIEDFPPTAIRAWMQSLGIDSFIGSSGRVFPCEMKAAPLLRAWLSRLRAAGLQLHARHRWQGWLDQGQLLFETPNGDITADADAVILALGGGSWSKLGSDGRWVPLLRQHNIAVAELKPSNCGFELPWSEHFRSRFAGQPVKTIRATCRNAQGQTISRRGEFVITDWGLEGGLIYAFSAPLRQAIEDHGEAILELDLLPEFSQAKIVAEISHPRGARSLSSHLQGRLGIKGIKAGLLREVLNNEAMHDTTQLAATIKALPLRLKATRPLDEAISSAGGVCFSSINKDLMLRTMPGTFCAGEMLIPYTERTTCRVSQFTLH